ncbi:MAG: cation transporter [Candidatus Methylomirabilales bacterium]
MVKRALEGLDGVEKAEVSFSRAEARVEYDPQKVTIEDMIQKVRDSGFEASIRAGPE